VGVDATVMRDHFGGGEFWWGSRGGVVFSDPCSHSSYWSPTKREGGLSNRAVVTPPRLESESVPSRFRAGFRVRKGHIINLASLFKGQPPGSFLRFVAG
jgi:hypothetical protein